jgi:hypothetical protein
MKEQIENGMLLPLDKEYKQKVFKSMTGSDWKEEYEGHIRLNKIKGVAVRQGEISDIFFEKPKKENKLFERNFTRINENKKK